MSDMTFTARIDSHGRRLRTFIYANVLPSKVRSAVYIACCNTRKLLLYDPNTHMRKHYSINVAFNAGMSSLTYTSASEQNPTAS
jgi:hypothetical protein